MLSYELMIDKVVKVVAERSYGQDEQVMISYGLKSSAECLEDHGTVPDIDMDEGDVLSHRNSVLRYYYHADCCVDL